MKIEKEWKNVSTAELFRILHQKVLKVWLEKFFQFFMTLDTIFFFQIYGHFKKFRGFSRLP